MYYLWYIVKSAFIDFWRYEIMEFWRFIFSSFWVWLGFVILVSMVGGGVIELVKACKRNRKVSGYRVGHPSMKEDAKRENMPIAVPPII